MSIKTEVLFNNTWNVRISDPGEEGAVGKVRVSVTGV